MAYQKKVMYLFDIKIENKATMWKSDWNKKKVLKNTQTYLLCWLNKKNPSTEKPKQKNTILNISQNVDHNLLQEDPGNAFLTCIFEQFNWQSINAKHPMVPKLYMKPKCCFLFFSRKLHFSQRKNNRAWCFYAKL